METFLNEARAAAKLRHPAIVPVHDIQLHAGLPFIVQEYVAGATLKQWGANHGPSPSEIGELFATLADALDYAHRQGVTHCDLKLANVLVDDEGQPHVGHALVAIIAPRDAARPSDCPTHLLWIVR